MKALFTVLKPNLAQLACASSCAASSFPAAAAAIAAAGVGAAAGSWCCSGSWLRRLGQECQVLQGNTCTLTTNGFGALSARPYDQCSLVIEPAAIQRGTCCFDKSLASCHLEQNAVFQAACTWIVTQCCHVWRHEKARGWQDSHLSKVAPALPVAPIRSSWSGLLSSKNSSP